MAETRHVRNNHDARRYELVDAQGRVLGVADYHVDDNVVVMPHTEVVPERRNQGLGAELVQAALDDVRAGGSLVRPLCWYVAEYIGEHPEYKDLVAR
jgi:predicted GNAT family acetyltransferase